MPRLLIGFIPYIALSIVHVAALAIGADAVAGPTKLTLMPLLAFAVVWGMRGAAWRSSYVLLFAAIGLSWLGDGAATFFPWAPEVPTMLLCFGLAHLCYIALFWLNLAVRRVPLWAAVYAIWWIALLAVLWPHIGGLLVPVALYGVVLGGTAVAASRCNPVIVWGGAFFLLSDSVLAFRLFVPEIMPDWTSALVMLTYTLGQGLIAAGAVAALRTRTNRREPVEVST